MESHGTHGIPIIPIPIHICILHAIATEISLAESVHSELMCTTTLLTYPPHLPWETSHLCTNNCSYQTYTLPLCTNNKNIRTTSLHLISQEMFKTASFFTRRPTSLKSLTLLYAPLSAFLPRLEVRLSVSACSLDAPRRINPAAMGNPALPQIVHVSICHLIHTILYHEHIRSIVYWIKTRAINFRSHKFGGINFGVSSSCSSIV